MLNKILMGVVIVLLIVAIIPPLATHVHVMEWKVVQEPTCTQPGTRRASCSCGKRQEEQIQPKGHTISIVDNEQVKCTTCGQEAASQGLRYELINGKEYKVDAGKCTEPIIVIPSTWQGKPVTTIAHAAFANMQITEVYIPDSITTILDDAFYCCHYLEKVLFLGESKLKVIDRDVFYLCGKLSQIDIPQTVTKIDHCAFYQCYSLRDIELPSKLEYIGDFAFNMCDITTVTIPSTVNYIGLCAFENCPSLVSVQFEYTGPWSLSNMYGETATVYTTQPQRNAKYLVEYDNYARFLWEKK